MRRCRELMPAAFNYYLFVFCILFVKRLCYI
nr:MAG TPA: hypothetical protein [Bacteriophage sp.]